MRRFTKQVIAIFCIIPIMLLCLGYVVYQEDHPDFSFEVEPPSYTEPVQRAASEKTTPRYGFTEEDIYLLSQLLCGDATVDGDGEYDFVSHGTDVKIGYFKEMSKVLCVVMNRQRSTHKSFPNKVKDIVLQKGQFSPMGKNLKTKPAKVAIDRVREWCRLYDDYNPIVQVIPESHLYFQAGKNNTNITR